MKLRLFLLGCSLTLSVGINAQQKITVPDARGAAVQYTRVDQMPQFPGDLLTFVQSRLRLPTGTFPEGRTVVQLLIDESGRVQHPRITQSAFPELDSEALRIVRLMPDWTPAFDKGKPVKMFYNVPVRCCGK